MSAKVLRRGMVCRIAMRGHPLDGVKVQLIRQSPRTGDWTTKLLEPRGAYVEGELVSVEPAELAPIEVRTIERMT